MGEYDDDNSNETYQNSMEDNEGEYNEEHQEGESEDFSKDSSEDLDKEEFTPQDDLGILDNENNEFQPFDENEISSGSNQEPVDFEPDLELEKTSIQKSLGDFLPEGENETNSNLSDENKEEFEQKTDSILNNIGENLDRMVEFNQKDREDIAEVLEIKASKDEPKKYVTDYLDNLLKDYPDVDPELVRSLNSLRKELKIGKEVILNHVNSHLEKQFGTKRANEIKSRIWPLRSTYWKTLQREGLEKLIKTQLERYYPDDKYEIFSLNEIKSIIGVRRTTATEWTKGFLEKKLGKNEAEEKFREVWTHRKESRHIETKYSFLKEFIKYRGGKLITSEKEFDNMKQNPTNRIISIKCDKDHKFDILVLNIKSHNRWCPECHQRLCEKVTQTYTEKIISYLAGKKFKVHKQISLKRAINIATKKDGMLKYDAFVRDITLSGRDNNGKIKSINTSLNVEYDGIQHDKYPNPFHKTREEFEMSQDRDRRKDKASEVNNVITLRIKSKNGHNRHHLNEFQEEFIRQLQNRTGLYFGKIPRWNYDIYTNKLYLDVKKGFISIPLDKNAPIKKPWRKKD